MNNSALTSFAAGIVSAGLFLLVAGLGLGFFFMFLPTLPLLYAGLSGQFRIVLTSSVFAAAIVAVLSGLDNAIIYLFFLVVPSLYLAWLCLATITSSTGHKIWFPIGIILLHLTLMGCAVVALMTLYYARQDGGIMAVIAEHAHKEFSQLEAEYGTMLDAVVKRWAFLIFSITLWLWVLAIYAHAWVANRLIAKNTPPIRASMAIEPFAMPHWLLSLLAICALGSLIGSPSMQFAAKSTIISLMLPYFLLGCALMHSASKKWPSRRFFLFFAYFMVFALLWPAFVLSAVGFFHHIKSLSGLSNSSKS